MNLEQTIGSYLGKIKSSIVSRITVLSLAGILSAGLGYGCGDEEKPPEACLDECDYPGQIEQSGGKDWKTCGNYNSDDCLEWSSSYEQENIFLFCKNAESSYCQTDDDCICSFEKQFKGNKEYAHRCIGKAFGVNPNFCSEDELEMAGPGEGMICIGNTCSWGQKYECIDNDGDGYYGNKECWSKGLSDCDDNNPDKNADNGC